MSEFKGINSVVHTIRILELFQDEPTLTVSEISQRVGIPRATTYRLLKTLLMHEIVLRDHKKYRLSLRLLNLGMAALSIPALQQVAYPFMVNLMETVQETVHFSILDGYQVNYIAKVESPQTIRMHSYVGWRGPLNATASGKVLLAWSDSVFIEDFLQRELTQCTPQTITDPGLLQQELDKIRKQEYAVDREELSEGLMCIAVPVFLPNNTLAAFSTSGPIQRMEKLNLPDVVKLLYQKRDAFIDQLTHSNREE